MTRSIHKLSDAEIIEIYNLDEKPSYIAELYNLKTERLPNHIKRRKHVRVQALIPEGTPHSTVSPAIVLEYPNTLNAKAGRIRKFLSLITEEPNGCWTFNNGSTNNLGIPMFSGIPRSDGPREPSVHGKPVTTGTGTMMQAVRWGYQLMVAKLEPTDKLAHTPACKDACYKQCVNPAHVTVGDQHAVCASSVKQNSTKYLNPNNTHYIPVDIIELIYTSPLSALAVMDILPVPVSRQRIYSIRAHRTYREFTKTLIQPKYES